MKNNLNIAVIILTYNEKIHIERCINSVKSIAADIIVIDSFSTDNTVELAENIGARVLQNKWENNHAKQLNWGLKNANIKSDWILRIDADEIITPELSKEITDKLPNLSNSTNGVVLPLYNVFMGKTIKRGTGVLKILRLFRNGKAFCENRIMDEHMVLTEGDTVEFSNYMLDNNLNNLEWWTNKHNAYSNRETVNILINQFNLLDESDEGALSKKALKKRKLKSKYERMPLFWRAFGYFVFRYFIKGGFLEGKVGFIWHFLQGFWYRVLVDAKIYEIKKRFGTDKEAIKAYILSEYKIEI